MRMKYKLNIAIGFALAVACTRGADAQWHSHDTRMYFDYGEPMMSRVVQAADGRSVEVRLTTANSMFSFLRSKKVAKSEYYAIRDVTIEVEEQGNGQPIVSRNIIDTLYAGTFDESTSKETWHAM